MTDAEILDAYVALSVSLREALRAHDQDAAFDAATRMVDMGERIIAAKARMETEGIRRGDGFVRGGGGLAGGAEFDYLTGKAYQLGKVDAAAAIRYCDTAMEWTKAGLRAIFAHRDKMIRELPDGDAFQTRMAEARLTGYAYTIENAKSARGEWRERKKKIAREEAERKRLLDLLTARQGILQSEFLRQCPEADSETIYYAALRGEIVREKQGRSYILTLPVSRH